MTAIPSASCDHFRLKEATLCIPMDREFLDISSYLRAGVLLSTLLLMTFTDGSVGKLLCCTTARTVILECWSWGSGLARGGILARVGGCNGHGFFTKYRRKQKERGS